MIGRIVTSAHGAGVVGPETRCQLVEGNAGNG